jgi:hypothetical protein
LSEKLGTPSEPSIETACTNGRQMPAISLLSDSSPRCKRVEEELRSRGIPFTLVLKKRYESSRYTVPSVFVPSEAALYEGILHIRVFLDRFR